MIEGKHFLQEEFKKWSTRSCFVVKRKLNGLASYACFVALTAMAVALWSPAGDNLTDIWNSPQRLEVIEADIDRINESLALLATDDEDSSLALND